MARHEDRDRMLAEAHARLHIAQEMVRWAMNAESVRVIPQDELEALVASIKAMGDRVWRARHPT